LFLLPQAVDSSSHTPPPPPARPSHPPQFYQIIKPGVSVAEHMKILAADLKELGSALGRIKTQELWQDYFPYVDVPALKGGYYQKLEGLQGTRGTYFAGMSGLMNFDTVESNARYSRALVHAYF